MQYFKFFIENNRLILHTLQVPRRGSLRCHTQHNSRRSPSARTGAWRRAALRTPYILCLQSAGSPRRCFPPSSECPSHHSRYNPTNTRMTPLISGTTCISLYKYIWSCFRWSRRSFRKVYNVWQPQCHCTSLPGSHDSRSSFPLGVSHLCILRDSWWDGQSRLDSMFLLDKGLCFHALFPLDSRTQLDRVHR